MKSKMKSNRATIYRQTASAKIHRARDEKTPMPRAARLGLRGFEGFTVFSCLRANAISPAKFRNSPSGARTNGYKSEKFGFFDGGTTSLQVNTDCASTTTSAAPSPKGGASGRPRRPQSRSPAPPKDGTKAPRGYCWGHHLRSGRRRCAKTGSQGL